MNIGRSSRRKRNGSVLHHAGRADESADFARALLDRFVPAENPRELDRYDAVIINAAGCGSTLKQYGTLFAGDPVVRQELMRILIAEKVLHYLGQKMRDEIAAGVQVGPKGSVAKLATAVLARESASLGMALAGPASLAWDPTDSDGPVMAHALCFAPMTAIAGGTSEIQRNTIGERVLGLPKEPQVDRDIPFRDTLQSISRPSPS